MKYLLMIYGNQELWTRFSAEQAATATAAQDAFNRRYRASGELLGAYGLADAEQASVVRVRGGAPVVTDGPYLEAKEYLASFCLVDVETPQRAHELAAELPFAAVAGVEVWPVMHEAAEDL